jgi:hypothetical protein
MFKPTYLYIKTHNDTGLKYFGKTITDPYRYAGTGIYWKRHLSIHGNNVSTEILGYFLSEEECKNAAINFSKKYNIVESAEWANLMPENGKTGGLQSNSGATFKILNSLPRSKEHSGNISKALKGIVHSSESNVKKSLNRKNRHKGEPKPLVVCRLSDRKEMSAVGFANYIRQNPEI